MADNETVSMEKESVQEASNRQQWRPAQVYSMAIVCLILGLAIGYLVRGSQSPAPAVPIAEQAPAQAPVQAPMGNPGGQRPTLQQMKQMADKTAAPLLEKLKTDPKNADLLNQLGNIYRGTHQFQTAEEYYSKALEIQPRNVAIRTDLASCLYYTGDVDGAIAELEKTLTYDPKFKGALLNMGIIKWKGKNDVPGAVASWQKLLKADPDPQQREYVKRLITQAKKTAQMNATNAPKS
jgi:cytochrome c-type biogenesis protein CcmH/NrfG